jgi:two-component system, LytTR family, response regulator LytT
MLEAQRPQHSKVLLRSAGRLLLVEQKDVCYASIEDGIISVATTQFEGHSNCRTLEELLTGLDSDMFWRAHRSFVVNINRIREQETDGNPRQPRPDEASTRAVWAVVHQHRTSCEA